MRDNNHRRSSDKIWAWEGRMFVKNCNFPVVFFSDNEFLFLLIQLISFIDPFQKY